MKVDERSAMILSSGVSICGVSACITAARVAGGDDRKLSYIVSLVLIVVVPMIYLMPWLAHAILPHIFDDPHVVQEVAGAWIGGTIDTTSGVAASSMIVGEVANQHAVIIKAAQNVLIGVVAFFIALYLSTRRGDKAGQAPSLGIVWEKFPKFIIGFVAASLVFSVLQGNGLFTADARGKLAEPGVAKMFSTVFFSLAFVCVGARYAPQGYRFPGEPQSAVGVPRRPGFQYRRYVPHRARAVRRAETDAGIIPGRCLSIAPWNRSSGGFSCFRPGCNARLSFAVRQPCPVDLSIRPSFPCVRCPVRRVLPAPFVCGLLCPACPVCGLHVCRVPSAGALCCEGFSCPEYLGRNAVMAE